MTARPVLLVLCVGWVVASLPSAGCGAMPASPKYIHADQTVAEYRDEAKHLQLAPGWRWPTELDYREKNNAGDRVMYEVNIGRVDAAWYWHCSWAHTFFSATDPAERENALSKVLELRESAFYLWGLEKVERGHIDRVLDDAGDGRTEALRNIIDLNCPATSR